MLELNASVDLESDKNLNGHQNVHLVGNNLRQLRLFSHNKNNK